jgi:UDP-apiose/xylose synthase
VNPPRSIAVLGAGGFIGSHLVPALLARPDVEVDAVDVDFRKLEFDSPRLRRHLCRIDTPGLLDELCGRSDLIVSLTALCTPALYNTDPLAVIDASYTHLVPLVERCSERGVRLLHFSTCEVYGRLALDSAGIATERMHEDDTGLFLGPVARERWSYACAKQLLERVIWGHGQHRGLDFTIVRPFNVIGPRMDFIPGVDGDGVPRVLACFMNALLRGEELLLVDGGHQRRSFVSIADFVDGVVRIVERPAAARRQIVNLGHPGNDVSIRELAEGLAREYARQLPSAPRARFRQVSSAEFYGEGYDDSERRLPDIGKARALFGWEPQATLGGMLQDIVADYVTRYGALLTPPKSMGRVAAG